VAFRYRRVQRLGCEIHGHDRGDVGHAESVARDERHFGEPCFEIRIEVFHPLPAAFDQGRDLLVIMRPGDCTPL